MEKVLSQVKHFLLDEEGASAVEYGVMVALAIAVCVAMIKSIGTGLNTVFGNGDTGLTPKAN